MVWGAWHGSALIVERALVARRAEAGKARFNPLIHRMITLLVVLMGWVVFRAPKLPEGFKILKTMFNPLKAGSFNVDGLLGNPLYLGLAALGLLYCVALEPRMDIRGLETMVSPSSTQRVLAVAMLALSLLILFSAPTVPFIYFQF